MGNLIGGEKQKESNHSEVSQTPAQVAAVQQVPQIPTGDSKENIITVIRRLFSQNNIQDEAIIAGVISEFESDIFFPYRGAQFISSDLYQQLLTKAKELANSNITRQQTAENTKSVLSAHIIKSYNDQITPIQQGTDLSIQQIMPPERADAVIKDVELKMYNQLRPHSSFPVELMADLKRQAAEFMQAALLQEPTFLAAKTQADSKQLDVLAQFETSSQNSVESYRSTASGTRRPSSQPSGQASQSSEDEIQKAMKNFSTYFRRELLKVCFEGMKRSRVPGQRDDYQRYADTYIALVVGMVQMKGNFPVIDIEGYIKRQEDAVETLMAPLIAEGKAPNDVAAKYQDWLTKQQRRAQDPKRVDKIQTKQYMSGSQDLRRSQQDWFVKACAMLARGPNPGETYGAFDGCSPNEVIKRQLARVISQNQDMVIEEDEDDLATERSTPVKLTGSVYYPGAAEDDMPEVPGGSFESVAGHPSTLFQIPAPPPSSQGENGAAVVAAETQPTPNALG